MSDWPERIERLSLLHQRLQKLDDELVWAPRPPPSGAASTPGGLPDDYREFLLAANGWAGFYKGIDLVSTSELGAETDSGLIIGHASDADDLIVLVTSGASRGSVLWLGGGEVVDEFESFTAFFDGIVAQTREEERQLEARR